MFRLRADTTKKPTTIVNDLTQVRALVCRTFYGSLSHKGKEAFHRFLWETLHGLWQHPVAQVRLASASTLGHILIRLAPFYADEFMATLRDVIAAMTDESFLLLACFCYLSKFMSFVSLTAILSETPIIHLFGEDASEHLPRLVKELLHLPKEILITLAEFFVNMALKNPANRHLPRAAAVIIETDPDEYVGVITTKMPLSIVIALFPDKLPVLSDEIVTDLKTRAYECLQDPVLAEYGAACTCLSLLLKNNQVTRDEVEDHISEDVFQNSPSLSALMMLPVNEKLVKTLYRPDAGLEQSETQQVEWGDEPFSASATPSGSFASSLLLDTKFDESEMPLITEKQYVVPLLTYFSCNPNHEKELASLITAHLNSNSEHLSNALAILGDASDIFEASVLNKMVVEVISLKSNNWIMKLWILKMLAKMDFAKFTKSTSDKVFQLIDECAVDKSEALRDCAKEVCIQIEEHCRVDTFKLFVDKFIRRIDVFDPVEFEYRLSFLAVLFESTSSTWTMSFAHLASLLVEAVTMFSVSARVMMDMFSIVGVLACDLKDPGIILYFVQLALTIVEAGYHEFMGEVLALSRPRVFASVINADALPFQVVKVDTDLTSNPSVWHTSILPGTKSAVDLLMRIQWDEFELNAEEVAYLFNLSCRLLHLFPAQINRLVANLLDLGMFTACSLHPFIEETLKVSKARDGLVSGAKLLATCTERLEDFELHQYDTDEFVGSLEFVFQKCSGLDFLVVLAVRNFLASMKVNVPDDVYLKAVKPSQRRFLLERIKDDEVTVDDDDNLVDGTDLYMDSSAIFTFPTSVLDELEDDEVAFPSTLSVGESLLNSVQSLTPFYFSEFPIPDELFVSPLITAFCTYSTYKLKKTEAEVLFSHAITKCNAKCVFHVLRVCLKNGVFIDLRAYLRNALMLSRSVFPVAFQMLTTGYKRIDDLPPEIMEYVKTFTGDDIADFVLNTSGRLWRNVSVAIMRFDPTYFIQAMLSKRKLKARQIVNLIHYTTAVNFPPDEYFSFIVSVISTTIDSHKKCNIARRLLTVFIHTNSKNEAIVRKAMNLLSCDVGSVSSAELLRKRHAAYAIEMYYEMLTLQKVTDCTDVATVLREVFSKSMIFGQTINLLFSPITVESVTALLQSNFCSVRLLPYVFYGTKSTPDVSMTLPMFTLLTQQKLPATSFTEFVVLHFVKGLITTYVKSEQFTKRQAKDLYNYFIESTNLRLNSGSLQAALQVLLEFLGVFPVKSRQFSAISERVEKLFETSVVPREAWEIVCHCCSRKKEHLHTKDVFDPHLRLFTSYQSHLIAERAAKYTLEFGDFGSDVASVIPVCRSFYATFYAIVSVERISPDMVHDSLLNLYSSVFNRALTMLNDPLLRVFAPIFALLNGELDLPEELVLYLNDTKEKMLAIHAT